jgi:hypothetical protein
MIIFLFKKFTLHNEVTDRLSKNIVFFGELNNKVFEAGWECDIISYDKACCKKISTREL